MNTLHARGGRIISKLPIYEYPHETFPKNTSMVIRLFTRTKNFDAKFRFSKVESLVWGVGSDPPPPPPLYSHMADYHTTGIAIAFLQIYFFCDKSVTMLTLDGQLSHQAGE